jgi:hypothetical protein
MEKLRKLIKESKPNPLQVQEFLNQVDKGSFPCTTFVAKASTAKVHKVCEVHPSGGCSNQCLIIKSPKEDYIKFSQKDISIHKKIQQAVKGTAAAKHINKLINALPSPEGPIIVLEYEEPKQSKFLTLASILQNADMSSLLWKSINFQFIYTIAILQEQIPGFSHNDTHTENLLIVPNTNSEYSLIISPLGRHLQHSPNFLLKVIDFGQVLAADPALQSTDGKIIWKDILWQNKMIDFIRFSVWVIFDVSRYEEQFHKVPSWYKEWLEFVLRWIDPRFYILGSDPDAQGQLLDKDLSRGMAPNEEGAKWLQLNYGISSYYSIASMLDDKYFDEFLVKDIKFSQEVKNN